MIYVCKDTYKIQKNALRSNKFAFFTSLAIVFCLHTVLFPIDCYTIKKNCHLFQDDSIILQQMIRKSIGCGISAYQ